MAPDPKSTSRSWTYFFFSPPTVYSRAGNVTLIPPGLDRLSQTVIPTSFIPLSQLSPLSKWSSASALRPDGELSRGALNTIFMVSSSG